jgi:hypothetical protein
MYLARDLDGAGNSSDRLDISSPRPGLKIAFASNAALGHNDNSSSPIQM